MQPPPLPFSLPGPREWTVDLSAVECPTAACLGQLVALNRWVPCRPRRPRVIVTHDDAFLQAIIESPDDDSLRLPDAIQPGAHRSWPFEGPDVAGAAYPPLQGWRPGRPRR
jgi:hypothetical protein